jgi:chorismate synthase
VKGVEIGAGFASISQKGSEHGDEMSPQGFQSNNNGGVLGGISTGQPVTVSIALKPTSSIRLPRRTINTKGAAATVQTTGRHDPCVHPRHADRRGDARLRADGPGAAPSGAMR